MVESFAYYVNTMNLLDQNHIFKDIKENEAESIVTDLRKIDFDVVKTIVESLKNKNINARIDPNQQGEIKPICSEHVGYSHSSNKQEWWDIAIEQISLGHVGVILLAGGQGTRLNVSYPKGMYNVNLPSKKSIYQIQAERIAKLQKIAAAKYPNNVNKIFWYIMTSESTLHETVSFFKNNQNFQLNPDQIIFFEQNMLPCFGLNETIPNESTNQTNCLYISDKWLLKSENQHISMAPDGNGGVYSALLKENILDHMTQNNVQSVHVYCVDNILVKVADPLFIGYCLQKKADCAAKAVQKIDPNEPVGVICSYNNTHMVIEYSEIPKDLATQKLIDSNQLVFNAGNICNHYFTVEFLKTIASKHLNDLKFHFAIKKIQYYDEQQKKLLHKNVLKMEKFVFDVFPFAKNFHVFMVDRHEEFSPLKNSSLKDSPDTCKHDLLRLHKNWLDNCLFSWDRCLIERLVESGLFYMELKNDQIFLEISPLVSYSGENVKEYLDRYVKDHF